MKRLAELWLAASLGTLLWCLWLAWSTRIVEHAEMGAVALLSVLVAWWWRGAFAEVQMIEAEMRRDGLLEDLHDGG